MKGDSCMVWFRIMTHLVVQRPVCQPRLSHRTIGPRMIPVTTPVGTTKGASQLVQPPLARNTVAEASKPKTAPQQILCVLRTAKSGMTQQDLADRCGSWSGTSLQNESERV